MRIDVTDAITSEDQEELWAGLRAYNRQFVDARDCGTASAFTPATTPAACSAGLSASVKGTGSASTTCG